MPKFTIGDAPKQRFTIGDAPVDTPPAPLTGAVPGMATGVPSALIGPPSFLERHNITPTAAALGLGNLIEGVHKTIPENALAIDEIGSTLPGAAGRFFARRVPELRERATPTTGTQRIGLGFGNLMEFLAPGAGEARVAETAGRLAPLARIGYNALTAGSINRLQGGSFGAGAALGGGADAATELLRPLAPGLFESGMGVRARQRAFGKDEGRIGEEGLRSTTGNTPRAVRESALRVVGPAKARKIELLESASKRPNQAVGLLKAPDTLLPLGEAPRIPEMPGGLIDAERFPAQDVGEVRVRRNKLGQMLPNQPPNGARFFRNSNGRMMPRAGMFNEFPDENGLLPPARDPNTGQMLTRQPTRKAWMAGSGSEQLPSVPQYEGGGVVVVPAPVGSGPIPSTIPNPSISLAEPRSIVNNAIGSADFGGATRQFPGLRAIREKLANRFTEGAPSSIRPENITPLEADALANRGLSEEAQFENPLTENVRTKGTQRVARQARKAITNQIHAQIPETAELDRKLSLLTPLLDDAKLRELDQPFAQRIAGRLGARTGALTGTAAGAIFGSHAGGALGALSGGLSGLAIPELLSMPSSQIIAARALYGGLPTLRGLFTGVGSQALRSPTLTGNQ